MNKPRKLALAVLASITIAGIAGASASSLGGLNSASLGSDDTITASCQTSTAGIDVSYTTVYNASLGRYDVDQVTFSGVDSTCNGLDASVELANGSNVSLSSANDPAISVVAGVFTVDVPNASATLVEKLSLVIQG